MKEFWSIAHILMSLYVASKLWRTDKVLSVWVVAVGLNYILLRFWS